MNTLTNLLKDHQIGIWCKRAAWIVLAIGLVEIAFNVYNVSQQFGYGSPAFQPTIFRQLIISAIGLLPSILFYFFMLYAAGALVDHVVAATEEEENDDMIEDEEVMPGQMR
jgi:hypothetical protein